MQYGHDIYLSGDYICWVDGKLREVIRMDDKTRQAILSYIDKLLHMGTGKQKSLELMRKYIEKLPSDERETTRMVVCGYWNSMTRYYK